MTPPLLSLPVELLLRIVTTLLLGTGKIFKANYDDPHALSNDVELTCTALVHLFNLSMTCRAMWKFCSEFRQMVRLAGVGCHPAFLEVLENVTARSDGAKARFLSLDNRANCEGCGRCSDYQQCEAVIGRVFSHFSAITALDLVNFPFTPNVTQSLSQLKALQVLSIREPTDTGESGYITYSRDRDFPRVTDLSIVTSDREVAWPAVRTILALFIRDLVTVSIKTKRDPKGRKSDFAGRLYFPDARNQAQKLKRLSIGYLECETYSLRGFLRACAPLDYLEIDCTGLRGLLPFRYVIDLLCQLTGTDISDATMFMHEDVAIGLEMRLGSDAYTPGPKVWKRRVATFACTFFVPEPSKEGGNNMIQKLNITFASNDEESRTINKDMRFKELYPMFRAYKRFFAAVELLSITMPEDTGFKSWESREELKRTLSRICRKCFPSIENVSLVWGQFSISLKSTSHPTNLLLEA